MFKLKDLKDFGKKKKKELPKTTVKYTQREWDRTVGYGTVPEEYKRKEKYASK